MHWEARVFGSEVMSYGARSGEIYLSDITLAFLEDSRHYVANYSAAGRLVAGSANHVTRTNSFFASAEREASAVELGDAKEHGPGYVLWGREAGCDFVQQPPSTWNTALQDKYLCTDNRASGCTPDYRVSAVCSLYDYSPGVNPVSPSSCYLSTSDCEAGCCGTFDPVAKTCSSPCDGTNGLPANYQSSRTATDGSIVAHQGGYNSASTCPLA